MSASFSLQCVAILCAFNLVLQSIEDLVFIAKKNIGENQLQFIRAETGLRFLNEKFYLMLTMVKIILALVSVFFAPAFLWFFIILAQLLSLSLWRGLRSGGSDVVLQITLCVLFACAIFKSESAAHVGMVILAVNLILSYFVSGVSKIHSQYLNGKELKFFLQSAVIKTSSSSYVFRYAALIAWMVLAYELLFPLGLIFPKLVLYFLCFGVIFHFLNFWYLGLNRFFWTWISLYPALYYFSQ